MSSSHKYTSSLVTPSLVTPPPMPHNYKPSLSTGAFGSWIYPTEIVESLDDYKRELAQAPVSANPYIDSNLMNAQKRYSHQQNQQFEEKHNVTKPKLPKKPSVTGVVTVGAPIIVPKQTWLKEEISCDFNAQDKQKLTVIMSKAKSIIQSDGGFSIKLKRGRDGQVTKGNFVALNGILKTLGVAEQFMGAIAPQLQSQMKQKINAFDVKKRSDLKYLSKLDKNSMETTTYLQKGVNSIGLSFKCDIDFDEFAKNKSVATKQISAEIGKILNVDPSLVKVMEVVRGSVIPRIKIPNAGMAQSFAKMSASYNYAYKNASHVNASIARTNAFENDMKELDKDIQQQQKDYDEAKSEVERLEKLKEEKIEERDKLNDDKDEASAKIMEAITLFNTAKMGYDALAMNLDSSIVRVSITQTSNGTECNVGKAFEEEDGW